MSSAHLYQIDTYLLKIDDNEWSINYYDLFKDQLVNGSFHSEVLDKINFVIDKKYNLPFRFGIEASSIQFTCAIFPKEKLVLIATKQLSYELSIIRWCEHLKIEKEISAIKSHANKIATIPVENAPAVISQITHKYDLVDFDTPEYEKVLQTSEELSRFLVDKISEYDQSVFEKITDVGLDLTASYKLIRIHLLKFLAILPSLDHEKDGNEVKRIFLEALRRLITDSKKAKAKRLKGQDRGLPKGYLVLIKLLFNIATFIPANILAKSIRFSVSLMAKRFIAGESIDKAEKSLSELISSGRDATLDQLGELVVSKKEADIYEQKVIEIIKGLKQHIPAGKRNAAGINMAHVSIKVSALTHNFKPYSFETTYSSIAPRLKNILLTAKQNEVFINIDAEHYHYRDIVLKIYEKVLIDNDELNQYADTGIVIQAYLRDGHKHFYDVLEVAKKRNLRMPIRLVKGAYWDVETVEARAFNFEAPQFLNKEETDIHFRQIVSLCLENSEYIQLAIASHNIQDHCFSEALRQEKYPEAPIIEHQCLHMTYEALSYGLSLMNWPTRNYIPVGNLLVGMAYLVRRIMENSSQVGILTIMRSHKKKMNTQTPESIIKDKFLKKELVYDESILKLRRDFRNIYPIRTYLDYQLRPMLSAFNVKQEQVDTFDCDDENKILVKSPSDHKVIGCVNYDSVDTTLSKIDKLHKSFLSNKWSNDSSLRHASLIKLSDLMLINRESLTSLIMLESGKTLEEAIADVDEAIDFIQFYVKEYFDIQMNSGAYEAKGVFGVIAPWNFPLAIPVGMTTAALVCGNCAILKPAEQTPLIAMEFHRLALEAGIPADVFDIALGEGDIGASIVDNEKIEGIVFTGSKEVGQKIYTKLKVNNCSGKTKTAITEMGGKNAIIVTNNCELDETVSGIIYAAFAHGGQKCSAASRIIIDEKVKDAFIERFIDAVADIKIGESYKLDTFLNPLASHEDKIRLKNLNKEALDEVNMFGGVVHLDLSAGEYPGNCVGPSVYEIPMARSFDKSSMAQREAFGPLIHIIAYKDLDEAIDIFNSTQYALTGGIYCQSQDDIDYLSPKLLAGNLYINRPNTGARVAIEPFGGFKMSGTGPKAGSCDYLYSFMKVSNEKIEKVLIEDVVEDSNTKIGPSNLLERKRFDLTIELVDRLLNRYESFFQGINQKQKDFLFEIFDYLKDDSNLLETKEFQNRKIPGQLNFDIRNLKYGRGIFLVGSEKINFKVLVDMIFNLAIGNAVNIGCANQASYNNWFEIVNLCYNVGFSKFNLGIFQFNEQSIAARLKKDECEFIVTENEDTLISIIQKNFFEVQPDQIKLKKLFISGEEIAFDSWERFVKEYSIPRSFAVNTMRHGAPLELDI